MAIALPEHGAPSHKAASTPRELDWTNRALADGGLPSLPPIALREDSRAPSDVPAARDLTGVTLEAEWKPSDWPLPANAPETDRERLSELRGATRWLLRVDLAASGRMRIVLKDRGFPFESGTELRARIDLLGHFLVWPNAAQYRPLPPGVIRSLFQEGRADVSTVVALEGKPAGAGHALEWDTERVLAASAFGQVQIERSAAFTVSAAGRLLCRWLIEFINGDPSSELCLDDAVPLRAILDLPNAGKGEFVVTRVFKKQEFSTSGMSAPPNSAYLDTRYLPWAAPQNGFKLAGLRTHPVPPESSTNAPPAGIVADNKSLGLRAFIIDGVVAAWLLPSESRSWPELLPGTYSIAWRDFLGMAREPTTNIQVPAHVVVGAVSNRE